MPIRIDGFESSCPNECADLRGAFFFEPQCGSEGTPTWMSPSEDCLTPRRSPAALPFAYSGRSSPSTSTADSDHRHSSDPSDSKRFSPLKESEDNFDAEDEHCHGFFPVLDPLDWDGLENADHRFFIASELVTLLRTYGGQVLLSKVGSFLSDETRRVLKLLRIRLLTFLKEKPQKKYFRIEGAGGGQVLTFRDLRNPEALDDSYSLDAVRAEVMRVLAPSHRKNALLIRTLGSSLSYQAKLWLKSHRLSLCQFLAFDKSVVVRKSHVYLADSTVGEL